MDIIHQQLEKIINCQSRTQRPKYYAPQWFFDKFDDLIPNGFERIVLPDIFNPEM